MRGLRPRAATGGCKIPCANIIRYVKKHNRPHNPHILKSRRKNGPVRPESAGIRQVKPAHENMCRLTETTARFGRSASRTVVPCRDDSPLSTLSLKRSLAPLRGKTQNRPPEYSARESGNATRNARGRNTSPIIRNAGRKTTRQRERPRPERADRTQKSLSRDIAASRERPLGDGFLHRSYRMSISSSR